MYDKVCGNCGTRLSDYLSSGYLGCPECYHAFEREIEISLLKIQGNSKSVGKKPSISSVDKELINEYNRLIKERENAGLERRFSEMAELTFEINELSQELKNRGLI